MPGGLRAATVAASRWNRWRKLASLEYCSASTLMATGISRRGCVDRYTTPMAPRPSSASIGYLPSCVVLTLGLVSSQYAARCGASQSTSREPRPEPAPYLVEDAQRQVEGDPEVWLVDNLADPEVAGKAAEDVSVLPAQAVVRSQPGDGVADRIARGLHQVRAEGANGVVACRVASRLEWRRRSQEVIAPWSQGPALDDVEPERECHRAFDPGNANLAVSLRGVAVAGREHAALHEDR